MPQDISKGVVVIGVGALCSVLVFGGGAVWWAASLSTNVANLTKSVTSLQEKVTTSAELHAEVKRLERVLEDQKTELQVLNQWINSTRIKLAEQGFNTPPPPARQGGP